MKVLTYNVQLFPRQIYPIYRALFDCHESTKIPDRVEKIITALRVTDADIMCLNEIWDLASLEYIKNALTPTWYAYHPDERVKYPFVDGISGSGLLLLSRYPIRDATFTRFTRAQHAELFVKKGFFQCTVDAPNGPMGVFGTHAQAYNYARTRQSNLRQVISAITDYRRQHPDQHIMALGDFNVRHTPTGTEYAMLQDAMIQMGLVNASGDAPIVRTMDCVDRHIGNLDYIFTTCHVVACYTNPLTTDAFDSTYTHNGVWLSDHMPVMAVMDVHGAPPLPGSGTRVIDTYVQTDRGTLWKIVFAIIIMLVTAIIMIFAYKYFSGYQYIPGGRDGRP
jgi:endonuclease/exonuclease/phosphatase family metal-dependent hydrolase